MITLKAMKKKAYNKWYKQSIKRYAKSCIKAGVWEKDEAYKKAKSHYANLLLKGLKTPKNDIYHMMNNKEKKIGMLWLIRHKNRLYICQIYIHKKYRNKGYGKAVLLESEKIAKKMKVKKIGLNVFTHNKIAKSLYEQLGFETVSEFKIKSL